MLYIILEAEEGHELTDLRLEGGNLSCESILRLPPTYAFTPATWIPIFQIVGRIYMLSHQLQIERQIWRIQIKWSPLPPMLIRGLNKKAPYMSLPLLKRYHCLFWKDIAICPQTCSIRTMTITSWILSTTYYLKKKKAIIVHLESIGHTTVRNTFDV